MASKMDKVGYKMGVKSSGISLVDQKLLSSTGFGLMGLTWRANPPPKAQAFAAMREALKNGANFWNGGEIYGSSTRNSLHLLNEYFATYPEDQKKTIISIKGGCKVDTLMPDGSRENVHRSIQEAVGVMGVKVLDLFECARVDPNVPIEVTMRACQEMIDIGTLRGVCLSECSADTIRRASKITKIHAVEVEFSLWSTEILDNGVAQACKDLDIPIVAYSPLGRGFLTGQIKKPEDIPEQDFRRTVPRFQGENFDKNLQLVHELEKIAAKKGVKPGQVAIAWIKAQSGKNGMPDIIPIPGATTAERVKENMTDISLTAEDMKEINNLLKSIEIVGGRYSGHAAGLCFGSTPPENA